jgi:hypothetical protein
MPMLRNGGIKDSFPEIVIDLSLKWAAMPGLMDQYFSNLVVEVDPFQSKSREQKGQPDYQSI